MILDAIDVGGGGIVVDLPVFVKDVLMFQERAYCRVILRIAGVDVPLDLDSRHTAAFQRAIRNVHDIRVRASVTPSGGQER